MTQKKKELSVKEVREKLKTILSRDIINFQNKKLIYAKLSKHLSEQIKIINDIEGTP